MTWAIQMSLNLAWTAVFFGLETIGGGLIVIGCSSSPSSFRRSSPGGSPRCGLLLVPYIVWVAFAAVLNVAYAAENFS